MHDRQQLRPRSSAVRTINGLLLIWLTILFVITVLILGIKELVGVALFLIVPGLILMIIPTLLMYSLLFSIGWFTLQRQGGLVAAGGGGALMFGVGVVLPLLLNQFSEVRAMDAVSEHRNPTAKAGPVSTIAIRLPSDFASQASCTYPCLALLYGGAAQRVIDIPAPDRRSRKQLPPVSFRIEKRETCPDLPREYRNGNFSWPQSDVMNKAVRVRSATGECLIAEPTNDTHADLTLQWIDDGARVPRFSFVLPPRVRGLKITGDRGVIALGSHVIERQLVVPLFLEVTMSGFSTTGLDFAKRQAIEKQYDSLEFLKQFSTYDLDPLPPPSPNLIRHAFDEELRKPATATPAELVLLEDYYHVVADKGPDATDDARLSRLLIDPRVTNYGYFLGKRTRLTRSMRDPILGQLELLKDADDVRSRNRLQQLQRIASRLPEDVYAGPLPPFESLMAERKARKRMPDLIPRLGDRGPDPLLKMVLEPWRSPDQELRSWDDDNVAALEGLCRLGPAAAKALPEMRAIEAEFPKASTLKNLPWRKTMVALGEDPSRYTQDIPPAKQEKYEEQLRRAARLCSQKDRY